TIKQISEMTGFSPATVSNALNHKKGVNAETSEIILNLAKELGYTDNRKIKNIKFVLFKENGIIIDDTPFFTSIIDGVQEECQKSGYNLLICNLDKRDPNYEEKAVAIRDDANSGVIMLGTELRDEDLTVFKGCKNPFIIFDYWVSDMSFDGIMINNADSTRSATRYLIERGHEEIGYLGGTFRIRAFRSRKRGYVEAMEKAKLPVRPEYEVLLMPTIDGAYRDMKAYLEGKPKLPTAYIADNDMVALGAMRAMTEMGVRVPEDVSIIGFDDIPFCEISSPRLTTIRVPKQEMGELAVRRIKEMVKGRQLCKIKTQVCTDFVERDSVFDLRKK
ncbi:MAG: LacI family DNA-binding transcriptional regulator, partial [Eubacterium sp.]|nr:LacI family DNA-binding transcriptional regulator [Eubacterium sp.]